MERLGTTPNDYDYAVFHQPNGKFPLRVANLLGFTTDQVLPGLLVSKIGNTYSASSILGLAAVLDKAKTDDRILLTSYGSGAGSDAFSIRVTDRLEAVSDRSPSVDYYINRKRYIDYAYYSKFRGQLRGFME